MTRKEAQKILKIWMASGKSADGQRGYIEGWFDKDDVEAFRMAIEALAERPIGEWISVSERLPKECDGHVLVSKEDGQVTTGLHSEFSNVWYIGDMCGVGGCKVIAWMPLPEPYREDGEA